MSKERIGETSEIERHMSKTTEAEMDNRGQRKPGQEEGGAKNPARSITKMERERTTADDGQMREAALLCLSSYLVLLSIREEYAPPSIPHYTPSVTVHASVCRRVCVQELIGLARSKENGDRCEPVTSSLSVPRVFIMTEHSRHCRLMIKRSWSLCVYAQACAFLPIELCL